MRYNITKAYKVFLLCSFLGGDRRPPLLLSLHLCLDFTSEMNESLIKDAFKTLLWYTANGISFRNKQLLTCRPSLPFSEAIHSPAPPHSSPPPHPPPHKWFCQLYYWLCPNYQVLFTASNGWGFFFTSSQILDLGHFSQMILPIVLQTICPTIRCCEQHLMVGFFFFLTSSPILDLGHFLQVILPIVLQIMPQPKNNPNHQVLWTGYKPNHQVLFTASDGWG